MQLISIIVPTFNSAETIEKCLKSIKGQKYLKEIIVVDNFSTDQTVKIANKFTRFVFKKGPERSSQRNFGAQKAKGQWLFFVDSDQTLPRNCLSDALNLANLDAVIIPEFVKGDSFWGRCLNLEKQIYTDNQLILAPRFIKKPAFQKLGGFDENLIAAEDWDLAQRLTKNGYKIGFSLVPIYNLEKNSSLTSIIKKKYYYAKNIKKYAKKHPRAFLAQANLISRLTKRSVVAKMAQDPIHAAGLIFLKSAQALAAIAAQF